MKLKYQMRGLGIGIIVTAILMGVVTSHGIPLTDAEIMARASELGMVDGNSLKLTDVGAASTPIPESEGESEPVQSGTENPETDGQDSDGMESGSQSESEKNPDGGSSDDSDGFNLDGSEDAGNSLESGEEDKESNAAGEPGGEGTGDNAAGEPGGDDMDAAGIGASSQIVRNGDVVTVEIEAGMDSYSISVVLAQAGLVESAGDFDSFLCDQAYSRKIVNGSYEIPVGASQEEIAKIITRSR